jgi:hypothetical protein
MENESEQKKLADAISRIAPVIQVFQNDPLAKIDLKEKDLQKQVANYNRRFAAWRKMIPVKDLPKQVWFGVWRSNLPDDVLDVLDQLLFQADEDPEDFEVVSFKLIEQLTKKSASKYETRVQFRTIRQAENEPFSSFYNRVKTAAVSCGWNDEIKNENIIEQLIAGQKDHRVRDKLFLLQTDDVGKYVKECEAMEIAPIDDGQLSRPSSSG